MKIVSQVELKRLKKKGKVRRKMGAQIEKKKPTPVTPRDKEMSGSTSTERPVSAPTPAPVPTAEMAAMEASAAYRDSLLERLIENNTQTIEQFRQALAEQKPRPGVSYRHKVIRDKKSSLIDEVISTPIG